MPVKNAGAFLKDCLDSVLNQRMTDWELLVVNDHSTDLSLTILQDYASTDARIQVFSNEGNGIIPALQLAYQKSSGEYITRMDADDLMPDNKLETLVEICSSQAGAVATAKVAYFSESGVGKGYARYADWLNGLADDDNHWSHVYKECVIPSPCWMMRREDFDEIGAFSSEHYPEDYDLTFRMYAHAMQVNASPLVLHHWRDHGDRASRNDPHYSDNRFLELKLHYFSLLDLNPEKRLSLWGAGDKGKAIATWLLDKGIAFDWLTDNPKKIGVNIYGVIITSGATCVSDAITRQYIMAVASPGEQESLTSLLTETSEVFWFC